MFNSKKLNLLNLFFLPKTETPQLVPQVRLDSIKQEVNNI